MKKIICVVWMMFALIVAGCSQAQDKFPEDSFYSALGVKFEFENHKIMSDYCSP